MANESVNVGTETRKVAVTFSLPDTLEEYLELIGKERVERMLRTTGYRQAVGKIRNLVKEGVSDDEIRSLMATWKPGTISKRLGTGKVNKRTVDILEQIQALPPDQQAAKIAELIAKAKTAPAPALVAVQALPPDQQAPALGAVQPA